MRIGYTVRRLNKNGEARSFRIYVEGLNGARLQIDGATDDSDQQTVAVGPAMAGRATENLIAWKSNWPDHSFFYSNVRV